jgi:hypothetical protein
MSNTLNKTLYDAYVPVVLSTGVKSIAENAKVKVESGIAYMSDIAFGSILKADNYVLGEKFEDAFEALSALEIFNPTQTDSVLLTVEDLSKLFLLESLEGTVRYSDREKCFIKLNKRISEADLDCLYDDAVSEAFDLFDLIENIALQTDKDIKKKEVKKEEKPMNNLFGNLGFGKLKSDRFKLSMNGIAVAQSNGKYVVYNKENNEFVDVTEMLFDIKDALFLLPAVEIAVGDVILHNDKPYYIVDNTNEIKAVSYEDCTQTILIPKTTMFGLKFFIKIFSMFGNMTESGEIFNNPLMLMTLMGGEGSNDLSKMLMMTSLTKGELGTNPMMLAMMLSDGGDKSDLSTLAMMSMMTGGTNPFAPSKAARNLNKKESATPETKPTKE